MPRRTCSFHVLQDFCHSHGPVFISSETVTRSYYNGSKLSGRALHLEWIEIVFRLNYYLYHYHLILGSFLNQLLDYGNL
jgi:hypothetical protein